VHRSTIEPSDFIFDAIVRRPVSSNDAQGIAGSQSHGANAGVLQRDMIGPIGAPAKASPTLVKSLTLRHEFGNATDGLSDPARFFRRELAGAEAVTL